MPICKHKKSDFWYINIRHKGQRIFRSTGTTDKVAAQQYHDQIKNELWEQERLGAKPKRSWQEAVVRWIREASHKKSLSDDIRILKWLDPHLSHLMLHQITRDVVEDVAVEKEKTGVQPGTVNRVLALIRSILNKACYEWEWIEKAPKLRMRKEPPGRTRSAEPDEIIKLLKELPEHTRAPFLFAIATGLRKANVLKLRWKQINMENRHIQFSPREMKAGKAHGVAISDVAMEILLAQKGKHPVYVFTYKNNPINEVNTKAWRKALKRAEIEDFRWHDLKHTSISWLAQMDVPDGKLQDFGQWSTRKMVGNYAHLRRADSAEVAEKLSDVLLPIYKKEDKK